MSVWPQELEHWGPSLNFQTAPQPPPLWQCSFWTRAPPCQELIWNFRAADTDFLSTRRGLPQVWRTPPSAGYAVVNNPPATQTLLFFPQDDTWQTAEVTHHSAPQNKTKTWKKKPPQKNESTLRGLPTTRLRLSTHRFVRRESHCKKTALSIEHCQKRE